MNWCNKGRYHSWYPALLFIGQTSPWTARKSLRRLHPPTFRQSLRESRQSSLRLHRRFQSRRRYSPWKYRQRSGRWIRCNFPFHHHRFTYSLPRWCCLPAQVPFHLWPPEGSEAAAYSGCRLFSVPRFRLCIPHSNRWGQSVSRLIPNLPSICLSSSSRRWCSCVEPAISESCSRIRSKILFVFIKVPPEKMSAFFFVPSIYSFK